MANLKIVTDSSCTMDKNLRDELEIHMVPLSVMIDGTIYQDDDNLSGEHFMNMMADAKELPKTSQPPIGEFAALYDELGKDGSQILSIHMTKALSGTVEAARQAANLSNSQVTVIDSGMIDQSLSFAVIRAAEMAQAGKGLEETVTEVNNLLSHSKLFIGLSTLENLVKGGRIGRATGILSNILNIRVIMELTNNELIPVLKGRGVKTFNKWFEGLKKDLRNNPNIQKIGISYAGGLEQCEKFKRELQELFPSMEIFLLHTTPIVATHTGSGAFAIMYY